MAESVMYDKVVVIGLDGADWRLLRPWLANGRLPTLAQLISEGTSGPLRSTIRPESSSAWASFATGVNPGQHGVYSFVERSSGYSYKLANGHSIQTRRFWDWLGEAGLRVGLQNIPFTYPPRPVNGCLVGGMLTPDANSDFTYPPELKKELLARFPDYRVDAADTNDKAALIANVTAFTQQQRDVALMLLREWPWDFFTVVFTGPDRMQHFLWADIDERHPLHDPASAHRFGPSLLAHYEALDAAIADIRQQLPDNTLLLIMSDHGFNGCARRFYVNRWLKQQGFLSVLDRGWREQAGAWLTRLGSIGWLRRLKRLVLSSDVSSVTVRSLLLNQAVNWADTQAVFGMDGGIRLNVAGRELSGSVPPAQTEPLLARLTAELLAVQDPETGLCPLAEVLGRDGLYNGRFSHQSPDLILEPQRHHDHPGYNYILDGALDDGPLFSSSEPYSGNHALDGILIAHGPGIKPASQIENAIIWDIAPTILAAMGQPIPDYMDGQFLTGLFEPDSIPAIKIAAGAQATAPASELTHSQDDKTVEARLRNLGYLD